MAFRLAFSRAVGTLHQSFGSKSTKARQGNQVASQPSSPATPAASSAMKPLPLQLWVRNPDRNACTPTMAGSSPPFSAWRRIRRATGRSYIGSLVIILCASVRYNNKGPAPPPPNAEPIVTPRAGLQNFTRRHRDERQLSARQLCTQASGRKLCVGSIAIGPDCILCGDFIRASCVCAICGKLKIFSLNAFFLQRINARSWISSDDHVTCGIYA